MKEEQNRRIVLAARPNGEPQDKDFRLEAVDLTLPGEDQVLLRTIYLSLDPYMRGRMNAGPSYAPPVEVGQVMGGGTVSAVVDSRSPDFVTGDIVLGYTGWQEYAVAAAKLFAETRPRARAGFNSLGRDGNARLDCLYGPAEHRPAEDRGDGSGGGGCGSSGFGGGSNRQDQRMPRRRHRGWKTEVRLRGKRTGL